MTRLYVAMDDAVAVVNGQNGGWQFVERLHDVHPQCLAVDPFQPQRLYCGTFDNGLWRSDDAGESWQQVGAGIAHQRVMSVAVSQAERVGTYGVVWAGTEPSALYRSEDGGESWQELRGLQDIPSKPNWTFPPRPNGHHVRWIAPDPNVAERLFVAIEQGGIMRSLDEGKTWEDHNPAAQKDGHTLAMHKDAPGRLYEASGGEDVKFRMFVRPAWPPLEPNVIMTAGGFAETYDGGASWEAVTDGLQHHYLWGVAVDPADPDTIVASASIGPLQAHRARATSFIYRRAATKSWRIVSEGLPEPRGTKVSVLAANEAEPGVFYALNNQGIFRSNDAGVTWKALDVAWPQRFRKQHPQGLAVVE